MLLTVLRESVSLLADVQEVRTPKTFKAVVERWAAVLGYEAIVIRSKEGCGGTYNVGEESVRCVAGYAGEGVSGKVFAWVCLRQGGGGAGSQAEEKDWEAVKTVLVQVIGNEIPVRIRGNLMGQFCEADPSSDKHKELTGSIQTYNEAVHLLSQTAPPLPPSPHYISLEDLLISKAHHRAKDLLANPDEKLITEGVVLSEPILNIERKLFPSWFHPDLLFACPRTGCNPDTLELLKTVECVNTAHHTELTQEHYCEYFLDVLSTFCIKMSSAVWTATLWEAVQHEQLLNLCGKLRKETWVVPMSVYSAMDHYSEKMEGVGSPGSGVQRQLLSSDVFISLHQLVLDIREDLGTTLSNVKAGSNRQLNACRNVATAIFACCLEIFNTLVNVAHTTVDRLGYSVSNILPSLYFASDMYLFLTIHFKHPTIDLLQQDLNRDIPSPHLEGSDRDPPKIDILKLSHLSGVPMDHYMPGNLNDLCVKASVLLGVCVDKVLTEIEKMVLGLTRGYCALQADQLPEGQEDDGDAVEAGWRKPYSKTIDKVLAKLVDPLCTIARHTPPEIGNYFARHAISTTIELLVSQVATYLLRKPTSLYPPPDSDAPSWPPVYPPSPLITKLSQDLDRLRTYLDIDTQNGQNAYYALPCWGLASRLCDALVKQQKDSDSRSGGGDTG